MLENLVLKKDSYYLVLKEFAQMKRLLFLFAIIQAIYTADSDRQVDAQIYWSDDLITKEPNPWQQKIQESTEGVVFNSEINFISAPTGLKIKLTKFTPTELSDNCTLLLNNNIEDQDKIIQLPSVWQFIKPIISANETPTNGPTITFHYNKLELSKEVRVLFVGLEQFSQNGDNNGALLDFLKDYGKLFKCVRLLGPLPTTKDALDAHVKSTFGNSISNWFFVDPSKGIHSELMWPSNWFYLRATNEPILLNIPEENEIVTPEHEFKPTVIRNSTTWFDSDSSQYVQQSWIPSLPEDFEHATYISELIDENVQVDNTTTKVLESKLLGKGEAGRVVLAKDLTHQGYIAIKKGKDLNTEYQLHADIYNAANGMRINGDQRLRIPTPLFCIKDYGDWQYGMSVLGPSLKAKGLSAYFAAFLNQFLEFIVPQLIIQVYLFHKSGYLHLDIKPDNFTFGPWGHETLVYLTDFGTAMQYKEGKIAGKCRGTQVYMSVGFHESGVLHKVGYKDDYESLAYVIFEFLNGTLPWDKDMDVEPDDEMSDEEADPFITKYNEDTRKHKVDFAVSKGPYELQTGPWDRFKLFLTYIQKLEPGQIPRLKYMLDLFNVELPTPVEGQEEDAEIPPARAAKMEESIYGILPVTWRRYPIYQVNTADIATELFIDPSTYSSSSKPIIYIMEKVLMTITQKSPRKKYHNFVDFGIVTTLSNKKVLHYVFLKPGTEEFIKQNLQKFQIVLVTSQIREILTGVFEFPLFAKRVKILELANGHTLETKGILDSAGNTVIPNQTVILDTEKKVPASDIKIKPIMNSSFAAPFDKRHLPFFA